MGKLATTHFDVLLNSSRQGAAGAADALGRLLEQKLTLAVGEPTNFLLAALPDSMIGPGLLAALMVGDEGALVVLAESSGMIPAWCAAPDASGKSRLDTLAQELGIELLPPDLSPQRAETVHVSNLVEALRRAQLANGASAIPLQLKTADNHSATAWLLWSAAQPLAALATSQMSPPPRTAARPAPRSAPAVRSAAPRKPATFDDLPLYARSLLRIKVPVVVTLAKNRQPLGRIMELGPGAILQFDKPCDEPLDLEVGGKAVAAGEAVKVGDKFGIRISSVLLPDERFHEVRPGDPVTGV